MTRPSIRRLGRTLTARETFPFVKRIYTTVTQVTQGGSRDGTWAVSVAVFGDTVAAPYNVNYINGHTPTVGDFVAVDFVNGSPVIAFRVAGFPQF